jgi:DNA repair exonuclease SbcCD nuclease subunit
MDYRTIKLDNPNVVLTWITDIHLSAIPPGKRGEGYRAQIFSKLKFAKTLTHNVNGICLCGGDIFHIKGSHSKANSLNMINEAIRMFGDFPTGKVYSATGNHDIQFDRMDTIPSQPLGVLVEAGVCHLLNYEPVIFTNETGTVKVSVETFDYASGVETLQAILNASPRPDVDYRVGIVHASGVPGESRDRFGEWLIGYNQLKDIDFDLLLWGHDHSRTETATVGNVTHINLGSLARAALSSDEVERKIVVPVLTFTPEKARIKEVEVPCLPIEQVFRVDDKTVIQVKDNTEVKKFFSDMNESVDEIVSDDPVVIIDSLCKDDPKLGELIKELCEY